MTGPETAGPTGWVDASGAVPSAPGSPPSQVWPRVTVEARADGTGVLNGHTVQAADGDVQALLIQLVSDMAAVGKTPVVVQAHDPDGISDLVVWPDGAITVRSRTDHPAPAPASAPVEAKACGDQPTDRSAPDPRQPRLAPAPPQPSPETSDGLPTRAVRLSTGAVVVVPKASGSDRGALRQPWEGEQISPAAVPALRGGSVLPVVPGGTAEPGPHPAPGAGRYPAGLIDAAALGTGARRRRRLQIAAAVMTGVLATIGLVVLLLLLFARPGNQVSPPPTTSSPGSAAVAPLTPSAPAAPSTSSGEDTPSPLVSAPAPAAAAPGYQARPRWTHAVAEGTQIGVGPDGLVVTRTPDGRVLGISGASGQAQWWTRQTYPTGTAGWSGPYLTRIDGQAVVVVVCPGRLTYWPVPTTGPVQDTSTTVALPAGAQVTWGGPSPLVILGQATAAVVRAGALQPVTLPAQARPLVADGTDILAVQAATWIRAHADGTTQTHPLTPPAGITGTPARVEAVSATYLVAAWPPKAGIQTVTLIEVASGRTLVTARLPAGADITRSRTIREIGGSLTGVGALAVDTVARRLRGLLAQYEIVALTQGHTYATDAVGRRTVDITTTGGKFTVTPLPAGADVPLATITPTGGATSLALTMTSTPTGQLLQALPASR